MTDDVARDEWLREALRHAPDAGIGAPPALGAAILREAQAKVRAGAAAPAPAPARRTERLWRWLAQPAVGAGLATLMIGTVVGTIWWDRPLPPPAGLPDAVVEAPPADTPASAAALSAALAQERADAARRESQQAAAAAREAKRDAVEAGSRSLAPTRPAPPPAPAPAFTPPAEPANDALSQAARPADTMAPAAPAPAVQPSAKAARREAAAPEDTDATFAALRAALSSEPQRWSWRRGETPAQPVHDPLAAWLAELGQATTAHWQRADPGTPPTGGDTLELLRDGRVLHRLELAVGRVRWDTAGTRHEAPLDAATLEALRRTLARLP